MGCATSKQPLCPNCKAPCSPMPRSYSVHVHHPPQREGETYHVVALTSTTLGSLKLDPLNHNHRSKEPNASIQNAEGKSNGGDYSDREKKIQKYFSIGVIEAKSWSKIIDDKIPKIVPKSPIMTPPGEPETINVWELMEGLDDTSPLRPPHHLRSFSFHVAPSSIPSPFDPPQSKLQENGEASPKPLRLEMAQYDSISNSKLKPHAMAGNSEALEVTDVKEVNGFVVGYKCPLRIRQKLVVYFTSLRGVRKTYEDCCLVRVILKGLGVRVDERDVSMHSGFKVELKELLGEDGWFNGGGLGLPRVFVGRKYIGGAEEIRRMHEEGQLEKALQGCEVVCDGDGGGVCEACGDIRFMPCETCSGSCKIYYDYEGDYDEECEEGEYGFRRCLDCNENGLIRCPICCE